jgi:hypothetical protein
VSYDRSDVAAEAAELRARAVLAEMQMRISQGPYAALGIAENALANEVRAAFLQLTKQFHPARFGRMSGEIQKLSNEVFLGIKAAHDTLARQLGARRGVPHTTGIVTTEIQRPAPGSGGTQRGVGLVSRTTTPTLARGTDRANTRPSAQAIAQPGSQRAATPLPVTSRAPTPPPSSRALTPSPAPAPTPSRTPTPSPAPTQPIRQTQRVATPPYGVQSRAPTGPLPSRTTTPVDPSQRVPPARPSQPMPVQRPGMPRPGTPSPDAINPPTIRYSGVQPTQPLPRVGSGAGPAVDEEGDLEAAMGLLGAKNYTAARQALHALAAKVPQSRRYRALLCYARGRETAASGRIDDAVLEFQRALQLDSELEIAKQAIRELGRKSRW